MEVVEPLLIQHLAIFRPGKNCGVQILHLIQNIEHRFKIRKITRVASVDLSAPMTLFIIKYYTFKKLYNLTKDYKIAKVIATFLHNRISFRQLPRTTGLLFWPPKI